MAKEDKSKYLSNSLVRGLEILKMFSPEQPTLSLAEISGYLGVSRTVPYRLLYTLQDLGYLHQDEVTKRYSLTPKVLELGFSYMNTLQLPELSRKFMEQLRDETGFSSHLGILENFEVVYIGRMPTMGVTTVTINVGSSLPAHATAMGKCLLAYLSEDKLNEKLERINLKQFTERTKITLTEFRKELEEIKMKGYAISDGEFESNIRSVAAPIFNHDGVVASVNVAAPIQSLNEEVIGDVITKVCRCAKDISSTISYSVNIFN
ncbi:IclR family transcriptional regulator [Alkalihalobacillus sp. BA299]|uniref:IclR family transcriptional regulator n=1 Tax=Alkalihalobacillus sp. BA299 TaxID=2815938 RepID=UPI001ADBF081|nr:IclR family transcriptional regulator [Alkalihalobacillus sp. BA299]